MSPQAAVSLFVIVGGTLVLFGGWLIFRKKAVQTREIVLPLLFALAVSTASRFLFVPMTLEWNVETFFTTFYFTVSGLFTLIMWAERKETKLSDRIVSMFTAVLFLSIGVYSLTTTKL